MELAKVNIYDKFHCIASDCSFSCCKGWEISVDPDTYQKWKKELSPSIFLERYVKASRSKKSTNIFMKLDEKKRCSFLNDQELCNLITQYGEQHLCETCRSFPRLHCQTGSREEYTLSCACPEVVDLLKGMEQLPEFIVRENTSLSNQSSMGHRIRDIMLAVLNMKDKSLITRISLVIHILYSYWEDPVSDSNELQRYLERDFLDQITQSWKEVLIYPEDSLWELKELFLDLTENYRNEVQYQEYLGSLYERANTMDMDQEVPEWDAFMECFLTYENLMLKCMILKILALDTEAEFEDMLVSYQMLVTEFLMVRFSAFLCWKSKEINYNDIRDYIVIFSRIIGYNAEGMKEFWDDSFEEAIWETGYMLLLTRI